MRPFVGVVPAHPVLSYVLRHQLVRSAWPTEHSHPPIQRHVVSPSSRCLTTSTVPNNQESDQAASSSSSHTSGGSTDGSSRAEDQPPTSLATNSSPFDDLFSGPDPFPRTSTQPRWLSDHLPPSTSSSSDRDQPRGARGRNTVPRSVLFTDHTDSHHPSPAERRRHDRKRYDRTPLMRHETKAFISLLNQALDTTGGTARSDPSDGVFPRRPFAASTDAARASPASEPFGAYTDLVTHASPQERNRYRLELYASRNRLRPRFQENRVARARRSAREGLAAQVSQAQLDAGIDEAREELTMCENEYEVWQWAKKEVWGIGTGEEAPSLPAWNRTVSADEDDVVPPDPSSGVAGTDGSDKSVNSDSPTPTSTSKPRPPHQPRFGMHTPYYAPVLHLLFLTLRDRYRSPSSALSVYETTRALGLESYVLGCTAPLFAELLKTRWDHLADLASCATLLRQARETGVLADPATRRREVMRLKRQSPSRGNDATGKGAGALLQALGTGEDEAIREVVDRIRSEVRKEVVRAVTGRRARVGGGAEAVDEAMEADEVESEEGGGERWGAEGAGRRSDGLARPDWAQRKVLEVADELGRLAGPPGRILLGL